MYDDSSGDEGNFFAAIVWLGKWGFLGLMLILIAILL